ncbi:GTPase HflX [archaeon]|nr:GTPase HflX [archaeon]
MKSVIVMLKEGEFEERKEEIGMLAKTGGYAVLEHFIQDKRARAKFLVGKGKVEEIHDFIKSHKVGLVIFENYLNSRQIMSLERELRVPVIDKYDLILNVFERHAGSREAQLQIELARLNRNIPYIKMATGIRVRTDHPGFGSSGEYIVRSTIANIHKRIKKIEGELEKYSKRTREQAERRRKKGKIVSIVGYTNVGKTTILNALTGAGKRERDELFTTLKSKTAALSEGIFLMDTIGFIRNLPHELVYAFRATLEEIKNSDLILIVMDASDSDEEFQRKKDICEITLAKIEALDVPVMYVLNKIDIGKSKEGEYVPISAKHGTGIEELKQEIIESLG